MCQSSKTEEFRMEGLAINSQYKETTVDLKKWPQGQTLHEA